MRIHIFTVRGEWDKIDQVTDAIEKIPHSQIEIQTTPLTADKIYTEIWFE
jgi:hypothetical protein